VHPQAMIYPLTVASKSSSKARQDAAAEITERMKEHSPDIVNQATIVSRELIRVAILWHELWHEGLEEASRLYFTEKNPEGMIAVLDPLHDILEAGASTARETSFAQVFGRDLSDAREACRRFKMYGETHELDRAWDIYYGVCIGSCSFWSSFLTFQQVFKKIERQLPQLMNLDLQYVSPQLLRARNLELAVPGMPHSSTDLASTYNCLGTYHAGHPVTRIASFTTKLTVIASKQRPRRVSLTGDDGKIYEYVLKGELFHLIWMFFGSSFYRSRGFASR
jgi:FKBP12-rapamycin complex-associated protein